MKKGVRPGTEKRLSFSIACTEMGLSMSTMLEITKEMIGKTDEEKEAIAEALEKRVRAGEFSKDNTKNEPPR